MANLIQQLQFNTLFQIVQFVGINANGVANPTVTLSQQSQYGLNNFPLSFQQGWEGVVTLTPGSSSSASPSSSSSSSGAVAPGYSVIDLTSLPFGTQPNFDFTGLTLRAIGFQAPSGNVQNVSVYPSASNGYTGWATGLILSPGTPNLIGPLMSGMLPISSSNRYIAFSGAAGDTVNILALVG
jgi:hypothetical protein